MHVQWLWDLVAVALEFYVHITSEYQIAVMGLSSYIIAPVLRNCVE
jgi:hypothetical protein